MKNRPSAFALVFGGLLVAAIAVTAVRLNQPTLPSANNKDRIKAERIVASKGGVESTQPAPEGNVIAGNGLVEPRDRESKVSSVVGGRIVEFFVKEGDSVDKGAPLAHLDSTVEEAALDAAEGDVLAARAEVTRTFRNLRREDVDAIIADTEATRARSEISKSSLGRIEELGKTGAATPDELDRARKQSAADQSAVQAAEARRKAAQAGGRPEDVGVANARVTAAIARRNQAKAALDRLTVRAPIAGQVLSIKSRPGEYYNPLAAEPLMIMGDTSKLRIRMDVDERDIGKLAIGASGYAALSAFPGKKFQTRIVEIGKRMGRKNIRTDDPVERIDTKILEVILEIESPDGLVPGLRVTSYVAAR
jgi:HlyD family secretion protein